MKLKVATQEVEQEPEVEISLKNLPSGSVGVYANGHPLIYIEREGRVVLSRMASHDLKDTGFQFEDGMVVVK